MQKHIPSMLLGLMFLIVIGFCGYYIVNLFVTSETKPVFFFSEKQTPTNESDLQTSDVTIKALWLNQAKFDSTTLAKKTDSLLADDTLDNNTKLYKIAIIKYLQGNKSEAADVITALSKEYPGKQDYQIAKAYMAYDSDDYEKALDILDQIKSLESISLVYKGMVLEQLNRFEDAKNEYAKAIKLQPQNVEAKLALKKLL